MSAYWTAPKLWPGNTAFILGGGPSLDDMDLTPLHARRCVGTNDAYAKGQWVDAVVFGDTGWYNIHNVDWIERPDGFHHLGFRRYSGLKVTNNVALLGRPGIKVMERKNVGLSMNQRCLAWNFNTGAAAINLAVLLGAARVVLLGFDMKLGKGRRSNWHHNLKDKPNAEVYPKFLKWFRQLHKEWQAKCPEVAIVNATPGSALKLFPMVDYEEELKR